MGKLVAHFSSLILSNDILPFSPWHCANSRPVGKKGRAEVAMDAVDFEGQREIMQGKGQSKGHSREQQAGAGITED